MAKSDNEVREGRILDAAANLFTHYGYDKTTVSDIAHEAGVSKGAIYLHFESKDNLFETLLMREFQKYMQTWLKLIEADPRGGTMGSVYKNNLYALNQSPFMAAIFRQDKHVMGNYIRKAVNQFQDRKNQSIHYEFLKMMQDAGVVRKDIDPKVTAHIMNILAYGLVSMGEVLQPDDIPPTADIIEAIADIMDRALTPPDGGNSEAGKAVIHQFIQAYRQQFANRNKASQE